MALNIGNWQYAYIKIFFRASATVIERARTTTIYSEVDMIKLYI